MDGKRSIAMNKQVHGKRLMNKEIKPS